MTVVEFELEEFLELVGTRMTAEECEAKVTMMGAAPEASDGTLMRFDLPNNRPDLWSVEGVARILRGYLGLETGLPSYEMGDSDVVFEVDASVRDVRPFGVGAIVRGVEFTESLLKSLIDLQEKLHLVHGRKRRKVAIGIHDVDKVRAPFVYKAVPPKSIRFVPLGHSGEMDLQEILDRHEKGIEYGPVLAGKDRYPIIVDADGNVLSFPPIINGVVTQLTPETRNLFLDVTGTSADAVSTALNVVCTALAERGARIESVELRTSNGTRRSPDLRPAKHEVDVAFANGLLGLSLTPAAMAECLRRMRHGADPHGGTIAVRSAGYRSDILHPVDLVEDIAIGYGFDQIPLVLPRRQTIGSSTALNDLSDGLRTLLVGHGYLEAVSLTVAPPEEPFESLPRASIANPVAAEQSRVRSSLLPSLLALLALNKHRDLPQRVFEVGDAVRAMRNVRLVSGVSLHAKAGFTEAKSLLQGLFRDLGRSFQIEAADNPNFVAGRCATVKIGGAPVGVFGEVHPKVLSGYELGYPAVAFEVDVQALG